MSAGRTLAVAGTLTAVRRRSGVLLGYGLPVAAAVAATATWFSPGRFVASGDTAPYLRTGLISELGLFWNHQVTGAGSTSHAVTQAFDAALLTGVGALGGGPVTAQRALYALAYGFAAFGSAYLAGAWVRRPLGLAAAGLLGAFNAFLLVSHPNVLPAVAVGLTGLLTGMVLRAARGRRVGPVRFAVATVAGSYLAQNPPLLVVTAVTVAAAALVAGLLVRRGTRRAVGLLARAAPWTLLLNLWWLVPCGLVLLGGGAGLAFTAQTDVTGWAWTHVRASVPNVLALNTHWGWDKPEYYPFSAAMKSGVWPYLRWAAPAWAALGIALLLARPARRRAGILLAGTMAGLVVLATGLHAPFGGVNQWLYVHVPGMWLLRDPMSKLGVPLLLCYAVLAALAVERLLDLLRTRPAAPRRLGVAATAAGLAFAVAYPWPMWTGAVVPGSRTPLPGARVAFPGAWLRLAADLDTAGPPGKVLVLPLNPYYQVFTTWGFYGADTVPAQLLHRPVLQLAPGGYFSPTLQVAAILTGVQAALLAGETASVPAGLRALGVSHVVVRRDITASPYTRAPAGAAELEAALRRVPGLVPSGSYPVAAVYRNAAAAGLVQVAGRAVGTPPADPRDLAATIPFAGTDGVLTDDARPAVSEVVWHAPGAGASGVFTVGASGWYELRRRDGARASYLAEVTRDGRGTAVTLRDAERVDVDGRPLPTRPPLRIGVNGPDVAALAVDGRLAPLPAQGALVPVRRGAVLTPYRATASALGYFSAVGDCNRRDRREPEELALRSTWPTSRTVRLAATGHSACISANVWLASSRTYRIRLAYRTVEGGPARICLWQAGPDSCAHLPALPQGRGRWQRYTTTATVAPGTTGLRLYLYADADRRPAAVEYREVGVDTLRPAGRLRVTATAAPPATWRLAAGEHRVRAERAGPPATARPSMVDCARVATGTPPARRLPDGTVELSAATGAPCVWADLGGVSRGARYRVAVDYRTTSGRPARVCVWQVGPNQCADLPALKADGRWQRLAATVRPVSGTTGLQFYAYADGQHAPRTEVSFRNLTVGPDGPTTLLVRQAGRPAATVPAVAATRAGSGYRVRVDGARGEFVLALPESYAPGWRITGLPDGWRATHFRANGYANGWLVRGQGQARLTVEYAPARWARAAIPASLLGAGLAGIWWLVGTRRRRASSRAWSAVA